jgi:predicted amidohydrolase
MSGFPGLAIDSSRRPRNATREIDAHGQYVMPGLIDLHVHAGGPPKNPELSYAYKLWLAHGITTVRGVGLTGLRWRSRSSSAVPAIRSWRPAS